MHPLIPVVSITRQHGFTHDLDPIRRGDSPHHHRSSLHAHAATPAEDTMPSRVAVSLSDSDVEVNYPAESEASHSWTLQDPNSRCAVHPVVAKQLDCTEKADDVTSICTCYDHYLFVPMAHNRNILKLVTREHDTVGILKLDEGHGHGLYRQREATFYQRLLQLDTVPSFCPKIAKITREKNLRIRDINLATIDVPVGSILMEHLPYTLFSLVVESAEEALSSESLQWRLSLCESFLIAIKEVHKLGYIHRDLKTENVGLRRLPDGTLECVIIDFEFAVEIGTMGSNSVIPPTSDHICFAGTPRYMPHECLYNTVVYTPAYEMAMVGIVLLFILGGSVHLTPLDESRCHYLPPHLQLRFEIENRVFEVHPSLPGSIKEWILTTVASDPNQRPTIDQCLTYIRTEINRLSM